MPRTANALLSCSTTLLLASCGGGGGGDSAPPPAPPVQDSRVPLTSTNYQNATKLAMGIPTMAFTFAKLGVSITETIIDLPPLVLIPVPCPEGGTTAFELTDQNSDSSLDPGDRLELRWNDCRVQGRTTNGVVRVDLVAVTDTPGGREYRLALTITGLSTTPAPVGLEPAPVNFSTQVRYARTPTSDHTVLTGGSFTSSPVIGDAGPSTVQLDYFQDHATQTYTWSAQGTIDSRVIGGEYDFRQTGAFTGVLGEYPSSGRLTLTGSAGSTARLSEEGVAAADVNTVFVGVDSNGDGTVDTAEAALAWTAVVPVQIFAAFPATPSIPTLTPP